MSQILKFELIENLKLFRGVIKFLSSFINEVKIQFTKEGILFLFMDASHIVLIELFFDMKNIVTYDFPISDQKIEIGIFLIDLNRILNAISLDQASLEFIIEEKELRIIAKSEFERTFTIVLIDIDIESIDMQSLKNVSYLNTFTMMFDDVENIFDGLRKSKGKKNEIMTFKLLQEKQSIILNIIEEDVNEIKKSENYQLTESESSNVKIYQNVLNQYSYNYIANLFTIKTALDRKELQHLEVNFSINDNTPLLINFKITPESYCNIYLAPRVNDVFFIEDIDFILNTSLNGILELIIKQTDYKVIDEEIDHLIDKISRIKGLKELNKEKKEYIKTILKDIHESTMLLKEEERKKIIKEAENRRIINNIETKIMN